MCEILRKFYFESTIFAMSDKGGVPLRIERSEIKKYNQAKYGIFWGVQKYVNNTRNNGNVIEIRAWAIDIDTGKKEKQLNKISLGLKPTMLVETRRGFHVYWLTQNGSLENYEKIISILINFYNADKGAKDKSRILRVPGFYHWKNENDPYLVKAVFKNNCTYSEEEILSFYETKNKPQQNKNQEQVYLSTPVYHPILPTRQLSGFEIIEKLSGTSYVNFEKFSLKHSQKRTDILVNGKPAPLWIDQNGLLGSNTGHCPTLTKFLEYYGHDFDKIKKIREELFNGRN